ncbi:SAF domain-containing protein [Actinotalea sp. AC32]|nr:SAF domain-containing protein [Actinotalea sp. AC32]
MTTTHDRRTARAGERVAYDDLPTPAAVRLRRPGWRDPRLLLGTALVGVSVLVGAWAVGTAGRTVPVLVAREALVPGEAVTSADVEVREVRLGAADGLYLGPADLVDGLHASRTVAVGELVPVTAVATGVDADLRTVAVTPRGPLSRDVVAGADVELWHVPGGRTGGDDEVAAPRLLVASATVAEVAAPSGAFTTGGAVSVHVVVPLDVLPDVLGAVSDDGSVEVVPLPGPARS